MRELARAWRGAPALRVCVLLAALARASAVGVVSSFTANDVQYYCEGQPFAVRASRRPCCSALVCFRRERALHVLARALRCAPRPCACAGRCSRAAAALSALPGRAAPQTKLPLSWAGVSRTVLPVDVTEVCAPDASGNVTSTITVNATQLAAVRAAHAACACTFSRACTFRSRTPPAARAPQADAANAIALIKGSACLFNRTSDYLRGAHAPSRPQRPGGCALAAAAPHARAAAAFTNRLAALTNGTSTLTGVLVGEGYPGKLPELMTPVVAGGACAAARCTPAAAARAWLTIHSRTQATSRDGGPRSCRRAC
jgi:hypothetical protein